MRLSTNAVIANITNITRIGTGTGPRSAPSQLTACGIEIGRPPEITKVRPRAIESIASVAMKLGSFP